MRFADPAVCPDCRGPIEASRPQCPRCGLDLRDPDLLELWQTLLHADVVLGRATARRDAVPVAAPVAPAPTPAPAADPFTVAPLPPYPTPQPPPSAQLPPPAVRSPSSWSTGSVLLGLGAIGLVVAALIFVTRSWDTIGLAGKATILGVATLVIAAAAAWATRRPLRASAEALWGVALSLLALDLLGARAEGLLGLDSISWPWSLVGTGVATLLAGAAVIVFARPHLPDIDLITPAVGTTAGVALAASGAGLMGDLGPFWHQFVALVVAGVLGLALRVTRSRPVAWGARLFVAALFLIAALWALAEALNNPTWSGLVGDGHGVPLLVMSAAAVGVAAAIPVVRVPMTATAVLGIAVLVIAPSAQEWAPEGGFVAIAAAAVVVTVAGLWGTTAWNRGLRLSLVPAAVTVFGVGVWWVLDAVGVAARAVNRPVGVSSTSGIESVTGSIVPVAAIAVGVALVVMVVLVPRWPDPAVDAWRERPAVTAVTIAVVATAVIGVLLSFEAPWWVLVLVEVLVALTVLRGQIVLAGVAAALALATSVVDEPLMALTWCVIGVLAGMVALGGGEPLVRRVAGLVAIPLLATGVAIGVQAAGGSVAVQVLTALVVGCLGLAASTRSPAIARTVIETGAGVAIVVAALCSNSTALAAAAWTIVGVTACGVAALAVDRRVYVWPGIGAFVVAYVLLLVDSGFSFIEAYTLPLAALALTAGVVVLVRHPATNSWPALGPGLALGLLPSLPQGLYDPAGLRSLLLGAAAVVVLALGARAGRQAPFVAGALVALVLAVFTIIGPYAQSAPRVLVIAAVSTVLVALGITWEDRVRDGRRVVAFVKDMT